jgi:methyl-accepting chemotaxis protein
MIVLSLVGIFFGIRSYLHISEKLGDAKSVTSYHDLMLQIGIAALFNIATAYIIYHIVTKPVRLIGQAMRALTEGQLKVDIPYVSQATEIGGMARRVLVFKQNAIDKVELGGEHKEIVDRTDEEKSKLCLNLPKIWKPLSYQLYKLWRVLQMI